jgi:hypothetical protein
MRRSSTLWIVAFVLTLVAAVYQRMTGPSYPVRGSVTLGGQTYQLRLARTHVATEDQVVTIEIPDQAVQGDVKWRRFPTNEPYQTIPLVRKDRLLEAALPKQPAAAKLEYQVLLHRGVEQQLFPPRPAVTRFKNPESLYVLIPHILAMFVAMLLSTRAGFAALTGAGTTVLTYLTLCFLLAGGFVLGPVMQKQAFGAWWTGVPFGFDLTDNKTLIAVAAWAFAAWQVRARRASARLAVIGAAVATLVVFAIPHSVWGSQIDWNQQVR